jgi:hypothetical protein
MPHIPVAAMENRCSTHDISPLTGVRVSYIFDKGWGLTLQGVLSLFFETASRFGQTPEAVLPVVLALNHGTKGNRDTSGCHSVP